MLNLHASLLPPLYARCTRVAAGDGAVVLGCFRADSAEKIAEGRGGASGWRGRASLQLPASAINGKSAEKIAEATPDGQSPSDRGGPQRHGRFALLYCDDDFWAPLDMMAAARSHGVPAEHISDARDCNDDRDHHRRDGASAEVRVAHDFVTRDAEMKEVARWAARAINAAIP